MKASELLPATRYTVTRGCRAEDTRKGDRAKRAGDTIELMDPKYGGTCDVPIRELRTTRFKATP